MLIHGLNFKERYNPVICIKHSDNKKTTQMQCACSGLSLLANYKKHNITFCSEKRIDKEQLEKLNIPNFHIIGNDCVRGESLSSRKNRKFLPIVKKYGIEDIIDLRDKFTSTSYNDLCLQHRIKYHHIPVDSDSVQDKEIIKNLSELFETLNKGKVYIACAQGLHRTDIALAINYIFNPKLQDKPPIMYGHFRNYGFKSEDISRRINSLVKSITKTDLESLGWQDGAFEDEMIKRKKQLYDFNRELQ